MFCFQKAWRTRPRCSRAALTIVGVTNEKALAQARQWPYRSDMPATVASVEIMDTRRPGNWYMCKPCEATWRSLPFSRLILQDGTACSDGWGNSTSKPPISAYLNVEFKKAKDFSWRPCRQRWAGSMEDTLTELYLVHVQARKGDLWYRDGQWGAIICTS